MGFFDETLEKAKGMFDVAAKKTEEVAALGKQKYDIAALKAKLSKNYEALGMIYYNSLDFDNIGDEETKLTVMRIRENLADIEKANAELLKLKNKKVCPVCSVGVDPKSAYCNACGAKLDK